MLTTFGLLERGRPHVEVLFVLTLVQTAGPFMGCEDTQQ